MCPFYYSYSGYKDELIWGASWLLKVTKKKAYREYIHKNGLEFGSKENNFEFGWDNKCARIDVLLVKFFLHGNVTVPRFICSLMPESPCS